MTRLETFTLTLPRPAGPLHAGIEAALAEAGVHAIRWAVTGACDDALTIEGARLCSPSST